MMKHCLFCNNSLQAIKQKFLSNGAISFLSYAQAHFFLEHQFYKLFTLKIDW